VWYPSELLEGNFLVAPRMRQYSIFWDSSITNEGVDRQRGGVDETHLGDLRFREQRAGCHRRRMGGEAGVGEEPSKRYCGSLAARSTFSLGGASEVRHNYMLGSRVSASMSISICCVGEGRFWCKQLDYEARYAMGKRMNKQLGVLRWWSGAGQRGNQSRGAKTAATPRQQPARKSTHTRHAGSCRRLSIHINTKGIKKTSHEAAFPKP